MNVFALADGKLFDKLTPSYLILDDCPAVQSLTAPPTEWSTIERMIQLQRNPPTHGELKEAGSREHLTIHVVQRERSGKLIFVHPVTRRPGAGAPT